MYYKHEDIKRECQWWEHAEQYLKDNNLDQVEITMTRENIRRIIIMLKSI